MPALALAVLLLGPPQSGLTNEAPTQPPRPEALAPAAPVPEPAPATPSSPIDAPPSGNGRLVGGLFTIGLGVVSLAIAFDGTNNKDSPNNPATTTATFASLGFVSLGVGSVLVVHGARARAEFDKWRAGVGFDMRKNGNGLIVCGSMATIFGGVALVGAGVVTPDSGVYYYGVVPMLLGVGAAGVAAGIGTLSWGLVRRSRYNTWRESTFIGRSVPMFVPLRHGVGLGLVGRF